jgi:hypothetical protein
LHDIRLDTPPDSDSENSDYLNQLLDDGLAPDNALSGVGSIPPTKIKIEEDLEAPIAAAVYDLLNLEKNLKRPTTSTMSTISPISTISTTTANLPSTPLPPPTSKTTTYVLPTLKRPPTQSVDSLMRDVICRRTDSLSVVQSAESVARVGKLPMETLAVLNKLPSKIFLSNGKGNDRDSPRVIDVVKVNTFNFLFSIKLSYCSIVDYIKNY